MKDLLTKRKTQRVFCDLIIHGFVEAAGGEARAEKTMNL